MSQYKDLFLSDDEEQLFIENQELVERLRKSRDEKNKPRIVDNGKYLFEPFDQMVYESKLRFDMLFYEQLLTNLDSEFIEEVDSVIAELYKYVYKIYEHINISPEPYNIPKNIRENKTNNLFELLNESIEVINKTISNTIVAHLETSFYSLSNENRKSRYYDRHKNTARELILDGTSYEDAISFSVKSLIIEDFLRKIAFPFGIWSRIKYLTEDEEYGKIFDRADLVNLVENFDKKIQSISKVITTCI